MDKSEAVEQHVLEKIAGLENFHPRIMGCRVIIDSPHHHVQKGQIYQVRIDLSVPGKDISVNREAGLDHAHEDVYVAIRDAFSAAQRILEDRVRLMSSHRHKAHPEPMHGQIDRIFAAEGYGFIEAEDGEEVYFQEDSLTKPAWDKLMPGTRVRFKAKQGDKGPFAIHVTPVG